MFANMETWKEYYYIYQGPKWPGLHCKKRCKNLQSWYITVTMTSSLQYILFFIIIILFLIYEQIWSLCWNSGRRMIRQW